MLPICMGSSFVATTFFPSLLFNPSFPYDKRIPFCLIVSSHVDMTRVWTLDTFTFPLPVYYFCLFLLFACLLFWFITLLLIRIGLAGVIINWVIAK